MYLLAICISLFENSLFNLYEPISSLDCFYGALSFSKMDSTKVNYILAAGLASVGGRRIKGKVVRE
jgi:hypothetical protein